jgi:predicted SAM-dependent methyltransferase
MGYPLTTVAPSTPARLSALGIGALRRLWDRWAPGGGSRAAGGPPPQFERVRLEVSRRYLRGQGIEIGALNAPLAVGRRARVKYVDRLSLPELRRHYPELGGKSLARVDIVDDGERLLTIPERSLDFVIANHMLEHCENPLGAIRTHLSRLRPGGVLYYAVPDKRFIFDKDRPLTSFEHLVADDRDGPEPSRAAHYSEYVRLVDKIEDEAKFRERIDYLQGIRYSIHFHVWDFDSFRDFLTRARDYLGVPFEIELFRANDFEILVVLVKP